jgi:hypothetical protein
MWILISGLVGASALCAGVLLASSARRWPGALVLPIGAALALGLEAVVVYALAAIGALNRPGLLAAHVLLGVVAVGVASTTRSRTGRRSWRSSLRGVVSPFRAAPGAAVMLGVLAALVALSALEWAPNNYDSMTYHLARVAHWIQNGGVGAFATSNARQNVIPPGAEYVVLVLQVIAGSDALANSIQLVSWILIALALPPLARLLGAPRRLAPWAALFFAAAPMAVLQAPTTQNDLVAAVSALAIVIATLPFLHRTRRWRAPDLTVLLTVIAAGTLVKPTAAVVAAPFLLAGAAASARHLRAGPAMWAAGRGALAGLLAAAAILVPFLLVRAADPRADEATAAFVYPLLAEPGDRALNVLRGVARHLPLPAGAADALTGGASIIGCSDPGRMCTGALLQFHEDYAGNPLQALVILVAAGWAAIRWRALPARARCALVATVGSWVLFHLWFRDNIWLSRLQLPLFPLGAVLVTIAGAALPRRPRTVVGVAAVATIMAAHGVLAASRTEFRPPQVEPRAIVAARSDAAYYGPYRKLGLIHDQVLLEAQARRCRSVGLLIGGDSYDYPLTWRAMQAGITVRHLVTSTDEPCLVFSDLPDPPLGPGWSPTDVPGLFAPR